MAQTPPSALFARPLYEPDNDWDYGALAAVLTLGQQVAVVGQQYRRVLAGLTQRTIVRSVTCSAAQEKAAKSPAWVICAALNGDACNHAKHTDHAYRIATGRDSIEVEEIGLLKARFPRLDLSPWSTQLAQLDHICRAIGEGLAPEKVCRAMRFPVDAPKPVGVRVAGAGQSEGRPPDLTRLATVGSQPPTPVTDPGPSPWEGAVRALTDQADRVVGGRLREVARIDGTLKVEVVRTNRSVSDTTLTVADDGAPLLVVWWAWPVDAPDESFDWLTQPVRDNVVVDSLGIIRSDGGIIRALRVLEEHGDHIVTVSDAVLSNEGGELVLSWQREDGPEHAWQVAATLHGRDRASDYVRE